MGTEGARSRRRRRQSPGPKKGNVRRRKRSARPAKGRRHTVRTKGHVPGKGGRPTEIANVCARIRKIAMKFPIRSFRALQSIAGVYHETLGDYFRRGEAEFKRGIPAYSRRTKQGSLYVEFYRMVCEGRSRCELAAIKTFVRAFDKLKGNPKEARKYLAIIDPENWAEVRRLEHSGQVGVGISLQAIHERAERFRKDGGAQGG